MDPMNMVNRLDSLVVMLGEVERDARAALAKDDMDAHERLGREYHMLADFVRDCYGVEARPAA